ncbi:hypothetical protein VC83_01372 [Pseudogymnoascus destructans]|uniref:carbonic anhydrase n=1 Tax=Pseudogymnoascus destructans TaxID=655981 RepID=A0A177AL27_9PEZI|nr:uncharacterized protein VC83_01372 [Pseudogymnoascus destructans]OAF61991.1 hypothetical protein VC83_01372 [Pseudogymnoascus destructans]
MSIFIARILIVAASVTHASASCAYGTHLSPRAEGAPIEVKTFGYTGAIGPLNWAALDGGSANVLCATGKNQSPINMVDGVFKTLTAADVKLQINDMPEGTEFENLGTTVEVVSKGGTLEVGGKTYDFKQFHFHLPSEHLDNGTSLAMEMHMVFQTPEKDIAVIGVFVDLDNGVVAAAADAATAQVITPAAKRDLGRHPHSRRGEAASAPRADSHLSAIVQLPPSSLATAAGTSSALLETVFSQVAKIASPGSVVETKPLVMSELVNILLAGSFQSYSGSLTTPPCSEGVMWLVSTQKLKIQTATFKKVRSVIGFNARYLQNTPGFNNLLAVGAQSAVAAKAAAAVPAAPAVKI